jgi:hypothetical protein
LVTISRSRSGLHYDQFAKPEKFCHSFWSAFSVKVFNICQSSTPKKDHQQKISIVDIVINKKSEAVS